MVGVPGRSKGCHTCRKRKIGCSLERPRCAQCIKSNRVCGGYQRDRIFVLNNGLSKTGKAAASTETTSSTHHAVVMKSADPFKKTDWIGKVSEAKPDALLPWSVAQNLSSLPAYRQQLLGAFLSSHLPENTLFVPGEKPWIQMLSELSSPILAVQKSIMAICAAKVGRTTGNVVLAKKSLALYVEGLQELQKALYDPSLMFRDETLGACMALATYELMECPAGTTYAYASHHTGCARLIQLRGAKAHTSGLGHQLFVAHRTLAIMNSLEDHRPTYLSEESWKVQPWTEVPKNSFDQLLDLVSVAPEIFRRADGFDHMEPSARLLVALSIIEDCWKVDDKISSFFQNLQENSTSLMYWPKSQKYSSTMESFPRYPGHSGLMPMAYHFRDILIARTLTFYWSVLTMLWTGMTRLYHLVTAVQLPPVLSGLVDRLPSLGHRADFITPARHVFQSVEYWTQDKMVELGPLLLVAPLSIVVDTIRDFPQYAHEVKWADEVIDEVKGRGLQILGCPREPPSKGDDLDEIQTRLGIAQQMTPESV